MTKSLNESLSYFKDKISDCIKFNKSIFVTTHLDQVVSLLKLSSEKEQNAQLEHQKNLLKI